MIAAQLQDVSISEGDQFLLYLPGKGARVSSTPSKRHDGATASFGVQDFNIRTRV